MIHWFVSGGVAALAAVAGYALFRWFHPSPVVSFPPQEPDAAAAAKESIATEASRVEGTRRLVDVLADIESSRRDSVAASEADPKREPEP